MFPHNYKQLYKIFWKTFLALKGRAWNFPFYPYLLKITSVHVNLKLYSRKILKNRSRPFWHIFFYLELPTSAYPILVPQKTAPTSSHTGQTVKYNALFYN